MNENHLKLNPKKTQFIPFSRKTKSVDFGPLVLSDDVSISPSSEWWQLDETGDYVPILDQDFELCCCLMRMKNLQIKQLHHSSLLL